jgi:putative ABC transport system ATP-binding protein
MSTIYERPRPEDDQNGTQPAPDVATADLVLEARDIWRTYRSGEGQVHALAGVTLNVAKGDFVALTGRSGSGKTTMLNILGGLDRPTKGQVLIDGQDLARYNDRQMTKLRRERLGFIFQSYGLIPTLSALENVELPLHLMGWSYGRRRKRAREVLDMVGLGDRAEHRMYEISGGQQQRVAVARALAGEPGLILADEPTGSLDTSTAQMLWQLLQNIVRDSDVALIAATHDLSVREYATRSFAMQDGKVEVS